MLKYVVPYSVILAVVLTLLPLPSMHQVTFVNCTMTKLARCNAWDREIESYNDCITGQSWNPQQYRMLTVWAIRPFMPRFGAASLALKFLILAGIFMLAFRFYRPVTGERNALLGLWLVAAAFVVCRDWYFRQDTYMEILLVLGTLTLLRSRRYWAVAPVLLLAGMNRETSLALIPVVVVLCVRDRKPLAGVVGAICWGAGFALPRLVYHAAPHPGLMGLAMFQRNVRDAQSWVQFVLTVGIMPLLAWFNRDKLTYHARVAFVALTPAYLLATWIFGCATESRLFLVPVVCCLIPAALMRRKESR